MDKLLIMIPTLDDGRFQLELQREQNIEYTEGILHMVPMMMPIIFKHVHHNVHGRLCACVYAYIF